MHSARGWLRLEGGLVLVAAVVSYSALGFNKLWFMLLLLAPDVSLLAYLINKDLGHRVYNLGHSYLLPMVLGGLGIARETDILAQASLIWIAHIGFDRLMGYGLKIGPGFKDTHLGRIGTKK